MPEFWVSEIMPAALWDGQIEGRNVTN